MADDPPATTPKRPRPERSRWAVWGERALEQLIRLSGFSAIIFVLAIFFFVFREAFPVLIDDKVGVPVLAAEDLKNPTGLWQELKTGNDAVSVHLRAALGDELPELEAAAAEAGSEEGAAAFVKRLGRALNGIIKGSSLAEAIPVESLTLSERTRELIAGNPRGESLAWVNRFILVESFPAHLERGGRFSLVEFLFSTEWYPTSASNVRYGILALIVGTFCVSGLAVLLAIPFSFGAAIFISEFCGPKLKETLKIVIELLAAIPSIVWGFIGLTLMSKLIVQYTGAQVGVNVLNGGIILALMCVPIITSLAEDALKAVPDTYREASLALGATRWQTIFRVLLPAAKNGLLAAALLGVGRAVGETMAVLMTTGHAVQIPHGLLDSARTLTANIAAELGESPAGSSHYRVLFLTGVFLFAITFLINLTADLTIRGVRKNK